METFPTGGSVLLGLNSPLRNLSDDSDIDFADVFGGPPRRRSAVHEVMRHSFGETADSYALTPEAGGGELIQRRPRWSGRNEKPVFGDELANRRRFTTDDFFNDIFGGNESLSSSPRKKSDPVGSNPGSRVLSPARPLPPKAEPFGTSLPAQFSLPAKLTKGTEIPTFGSPVHSLNKNRDTGLNGSAAYSYSPLSRSSSQANLDQRQENVSNRSASKGVAGDVQEKGVAGSEGSGRGRQFHFSIYKWPNRGVPVVMPLGRWGGSRLRGKAKVEAVAEEMISQPGTLNDVGVTTDDKALRDTESLGIGREAGEDEESDLPPLDVTDKETVAAADESAHTKGKTKPDMLSKLHLSGQPVKEASSDVSESRGIKLKALGSFLFDKDDEQGEGEARKDKSNTKNTRYSSGDSKSEKKPEGRSSLDRVKSAKSSSPSSCSTPGEASKNGVKGKVKEFVKIFNQGASILASGEPLGKSSRWRAKENVVVDINNTTSVDPTVRMSSEQKKPSPDSPAVGQKPSWVSEKKDPSAQNMKNGGSHGVSGQEDRQESNTAQTTLEDTEEFFHVNFQVKEITEDDKKLEQTGNDAEEIQIINAEVRKWSNGKDGNIRSLLSTLQYILWPGSGWKPVPLMDMIEGNAVRRSYQKALLILHPDKLQQKGASANQKYIAEKVFKLLQEAWNHFNSLGPL